MTTSPAPTSAPIAVSCGEPAGIGLELIHKARTELAGALSFFVIGDPAHLAAFGPIVEIQDPQKAAHVIADGVPVLAHDFGPLAVPGQPNPDHAKPIIDVIAKGVALTRDGMASALCTLPIHKKALKDGAGFAFPGHTEYLADLCDVDHVVMLLASPELRVVPATIHIPLEQVADTLTPALLEQTIRTTTAALQTDFGIAEPRLAIAGLNPHAGEGGAIGHQEVDWIAPLTDRLCAEGFALTGPTSADTLFHAAARVRYDVAICMYHDQALIPIKTLDFDRGVNVTLGLPITRTSPDHGTGFDIAGQGKANPGSLIEALRLAQKMAATRAQAHGNN